MKIHHALPERAPERPRVVAVGFFDGFHRGHRAIVREALRLRRAGERSAVLTFREHPAAFLRPGQEPPLIATLEERVNAFARAGIDEAYVLPFDASIASLTPEQFLDDVLIGRIGARAMVVGANFRFGSKRAGDVAFAQSHLGERGRVMVGGRRTRSTTASGSARPASGPPSRPPTWRRRTGCSARPTRCAERWRSAPGAATIWAIRPPTSPSRRASCCRPTASIAITGRHDGRDYLGPGLDRHEPDLRRQRAHRRGLAARLQRRRCTARSWCCATSASCAASASFDSVDELIAQMREDAATVKFPSVV